jgi:hypothetical protein
MLSPSCATDDREPSETPAASWSLASAILAAGLTAALACAPPLEPRVITLPDPGAVPAAHITDIRDYRRAAETIAALLEREVGVPRFPVALRFFPTPEAFEQMLLQVGYDPKLARETAREMRAVGGYRGVLLNESKLVTLSWADRVALLAHELTHSLQYELGGGKRGASDQWLREGFADWTAMRVAERLGVLRRGELRRQRIEAFRSSGERIWPLAEMVTFPQWVALSARSDGESYLQAFFAVDFLVERYGVPAILDYFSRFARSDDRLGNFRATFGEELAAFEKALAARLRRL